MTGKTGNASPAAPAPRQITPAPRQGWRQVACDWHLWPLRIYYEDTDAGGVVYHARYLGFAERGRTEMMRARGYDMAAIVGEGHGFTVRSLSADYLAPARLDDLVLVASRVDRMGHSGMEMTQEIQAQDPLSGEGGGQGGGRLLARLVVTLVWVNRDFRPARLPGGLRASLLGNGVDSTSRR